MEILQYIVYALQIFCFFYAFVLLIDIHGHTKAMHKARKNAEQKVYNYAPLEEEIKRLKSKNKQLVKNYEMYIADISAALAECQASRKDAFEALKSTPDKSDGICELCAKALNNQTGLDRVASGKTIEEFTQSVKDFHEPLFEAGETERLTAEEPKKPKKKSNLCECCAGSGEAANGFDDCQNCFGTGQANPLKTKM